MIYPDTYLNSFHPYQSTTQTDETICIPIAGAFNGWSYMSAYSITNLHIQFILYTRFAFFVSTMQVENPFFVSTMQVENPFFVSTMQVVNPFHAGCEPLSCS